jgi:YidC/Oxa1 family membrane protein insertase
MVIALAVLVGYNYVLHLLYPDWKPGQSNQQQNPAPPATTQVATTQQGVTTQPLTTGPTTAQVVAPGVTTVPAVTAGSWRAVGDDAASSQLQLGSGARNDKSWAMGVELVRKGAAVNAITLNSFLKTAEDKNTPYTFEEPLKVDGQLREDTRSLLTRSVVVDGREIDLSGVLWKVDAVDTSSARLSVEVRGAGDVPVARVTKTYKLSPRTDDPKSSLGYQLNVAHQVENLTDKPINAWVHVNGPTVPPRELDRDVDQYLIAGYWNEAEIRVVSYMLPTDFTKDAPWKELTKGAKGQALAWAGAQSAYFNAILRPIPRAGSAQGRAAEWLFKVSGELLNPATPKPEDHRVVERFEADLGSIPAKGSTQVEFEGYFGPKGRAVLKADYYTAAERQYHHTLVITPASGIAWLCSICTWQWLINVLVWMLTMFFFVVRDWGLAIIGLVLVVRALLHPITKKSQVHMVKMQKMGPEMEKLRKKYADDKDALARAQMQFYKEQGFTPVLGCLPMFLQMPIWIALWNALQSTFELRHAPLLYGLTWIHDLSRPDFLIRFNSTWHLPFGMTVAGLNILPILMGAVFYLQMKFQPKPPTMTPEQEQQQKIMTWMSTLLFPLFLYNGPSGLNMYILTSTAFGILESKVIRQHIKEREALEALGPTIVDAPPPSKGGGGGGQKKKDKDDPQKPKGWLQRLQEKAEQVQREANKRKR